jgi:hypothetical protein
MDDGLGTVHDLEPVYARAAAGEPASHDSCICTPEGCGGEAYPEAPGYCTYCAELDGEAHCPRCPYECCAVRADSTDCRRADQDG